MIEKYVIKFYEEKWTTFNQIYSFSKYCKKKVTCGQKVENILLHYGILNSFKIANNV